MNFWDRSRAPASSLMRRGAVLAILTAALYAGGMPADMVKAGEIQETVDQLLEEDISIT